MGTIRSSDTTEKDTPTVLEATGTSPTKEQKHSLVLLAPKDICLLSRCPLSLTPFPGPRAWGILYSRTPRPPCHVTGSPTLASGLQEPTPSQALDKRGNTEQDRCCGKKDMSGSPRPMCRDTAL